MLTLGSQFALGTLLSLPLEAETAGRLPHPQDMHTGFWGPELPTSHTELAGQCLTPETFLQFLKPYLFIYLFSV